MGSLPICVGCSWGSDLLTACSVRYPAVLHLELFLILLLRRPSSYHRCLDTLALCLWFRTCFHLYCRAKESVHTVKGLTMTQLRCVALRITSSRVATIRVCLVFVHDQVTDDIVIWVSCTSSYSPTVDPALKYNQFSSICSTIGVLKDLQRYCSKPKMVSAKLVAYL